MMPISERSRLVGLFLKRVRVVLTAMAIATGNAMTAHAQGDHLDIRGQLSTSYDDNVTYARTNEIDDILESVLVGVDVKSETSRNNFLASLDVTQNIYFGHSSFNNTAVGLRVRDRFEASPRLRLNGFDEFSSAQVPSSFEDEFGRTNGRYRTNRNGLGLGADYDLNSHMMLQWNYGHELTDYSRKDLTNSNEHRTGGRVQYAFDDANRIGVGYQYAHRFFETGTELVDHAVYGDYGHHFTKQLSLKVTAGQDFIDSDLNGTSRQGRYEIALTNDIDASTRGSLRYRKGLKSEAHSQNLFDSYQFSAQIRRELTQRIAINGAAFYGEGEYQTTRIRDRLKGAGAGLDYAATQDIDAGVNYNFLETDSNDADRSYRRNVFSFQTTMRF